MQNRGYTFRSRYINTYPTQETRCIQAPGASAFFNHQPVLNTLYIQNNH